MYISMGPICFFTSICMNTYLRLPVYKCGTAHTVSTQIFICLYIRVMFGLALVIDRGIYIYTYLCIFTFIYVFTYLPKHLYKSINVYIDRHMYVYVCPLDA